MNDDKNRQTGNENWMDKYAMDDDRSTSSPRTEESDLDWLQVVDNTKSKRSKRNKESLGKRFIKSIIPWKGDPALEVIRKLLLIIAIIVLIGCLVWGAGRLIERYHSSQQTSELENLIDESSELTLEEAQALYPDVEFPEGMQPKFYQHYALNQDFVGWLTIEGKNISLPIVQGDDNDYYLYRDFYGQDTDYGNPFLDYRNTIVEPFDQNTIIYGHYMRDEMIFSSLKEYRSISGFQESPVIEFDTLYRDTKWKVYAVYQTNADPADDNGYVFDYLYTNFPSEESFESFIEAVDERKLYTTGVDINSSDKIITLSTCSYNYDSERLVVVARLVREGEDETVDTSKAYANPSPRYPQAWYDENGRENPYKDADRWTIDG